MARGEFDLTLISVYITIMNTKHTKTLEQFQNLLENAWMFVNTSSVPKDDAIAQNLKTVLVKQIQDGLKYVEDIDRVSLVPTPEWLPENLVSARNWAQRIHDGQMYGDKPYVYHLDAVVKVLIRFGIKDLSILRGGYGHDAIEDRGLSYNDVKNEWGNEVADIIYDLSDEKGKSRKEKKEKTYPALRANMKAVVVKVADRIANMEENGKGSMYAKEFEDFQKNLRIYGHIPEMWEQLASLVEKAKDETPKKNVQNFDVSNMSGIG